MKTRPPVFSQRTSQRLHWSLPFKHLLLVCCASLTFARALAVDTPTLSPDGGYYKVYQTVTVSCSTPGVTLHYNEWGGEPSIFDPVVANGGTLSIQKLTSLRVKAFDGSGAESDTKAGDYYITGQIECGHQHTAALRADGTVWSWGGNINGQIGNGTTVDQLMPAPVSGMTNVTAISTGSFHTLALKSDGTVWAWGGSKSQGGASDTTPNVPAQVAGLSNVVAVEAGYQFSVVIKNDGTVWSWGYSTYGSSGQSGNTSTPAQITGLTNVVAAAAGEQYTVFLKSDGTVWAVGRLNSSLYQGPGLVQIAGISNVVELDSGYAHLLFRKSNNTVWGIGRNYERQLGLGNTQSALNAPTQLTNFPATVRRVFCGDYTSAVLDESGNLYAAGMNTNGQLGVGHRNEVLTPEYIPVSGGTALTSGYLFSIVTLQDGRIMATGRRPSYGTGLGRYAQFEKPLQLLNFTNIASMEGGATHTLFVTKDGGTYGMGENYNGQLATDVTYVTTTPQFLSSYDTAKTVSAGISHTLAIVGPSRIVRGSGTDSSGQLGDGTTTASVFSPVQAGTLTGAQGVAAGAFHSMVLDGSQNVWTFGGNSSGQLGRGNTTPSTTPIQVASLTGITAVAAGNNYCLALKSDGNVWTWGTAVGSVTLPPILSPALYPGISSVQSMSAARIGGSFLKTNGTVWIYGDNNFGNFGTGTMAFSYARNPVQVTGLTNVAQVASGLYYHLALKTDGTVWAWGHNNLGQLGDGTFTDRSSPVQVNGLGKIVKIAAGDDQSLALKEDGTLMVWGSSQWGQLGVGETDLVTSHLHVPGFNVLQQPPTVAITAPTGGTLVPLGQSVSLEAAAFDLDGTVSYVDFYVGNQYLTTAYNNGANFSGLYTPTTYGDFTVTAIAYDDTSTQSLRTATRTFNVPYDSEPDGLPDWWEIFWFGSLNDPQGGPSDNPDGDAYTNLQEYQNGTNPLVHEQFADLRVAEIVGAGVTYSNPQYFGNHYALDFFTNGLAAGLEIDQGVVISSGFDTNYFHANSSTSYQGDRGEPGDPDLDTILDVTTYDAAGLEFDFTIAPGNTAVEIELILASDEYNEWDGIGDSLYNDGVAVIINDTNIATVPDGMGNDKPVSVSWINQFINSAWFVNNDLPAAPYAIEFDGFTKKLTFRSQALTPGVTYHAKIVLADARDGIYDAAVYLKKDSFKAVP